MRLADLLQAGEWLAIGGGFAVCAACLMLALIHVGGRNAGGRSDG